VGTVFDKSTHANIRNFW